MMEKIHKAFRRIRRNIARLIVGYDRCPPDCRKKYKRLTAMTAKSILFVIGAVIFFLALALFFN